MAIGAGEYALRGRACGIVAASPGQVKAAEPREEAGPWTTHRARRRRPRLLAGGRAGQTTPARRHRNAPLDGAAAPYVMVRSWRSAAWPGTARPRRNGGGDDEAAPRAGQCVQPDFADLVRTSCRRVRTGGANNAPGILGAIEAGCCARPLSWPGWGRGWPTPRRRPFMCADASGAGPAAARAPHRPDGTGFVQAAARRGILSSPSDGAPARGQVAMAGRLEMLTRGATATHRSS